MSIQGSINSIVSSAARGILAVKGLKNLAKDVPKLEAAQQRVTQQQASMSSQRRNFMDYLAKQTSSLGGKVGDLPKNLQKQIASQYTKSQRTAMMDRMDKQNGNK